MALLECFAGTAEIEQKCAQCFYLVINPSVENRDDAAFNGKTFDVTVDGGEPRQVTLNEELNFTLVFNDHDPHAVAVAHASGFRGTANGTGGPRDNPTHVDLVLSKPWNLVVLAKEKWPNQEELEVFKQAKLKIAGEDKTAGDDGKFESQNRVLADTCSFALNVTGLGAGKCQVTVKTQLPSSVDGFLPVVAPTETTETRNAVNVVSNHPGATITVTYVMEVSVISPKLEADPIAIVDREVAGHPASLSVLTLGVVRGAHPLDDLAEIAAELTFDDKIECFQNANGTGAYASGTSKAPSALPATLYVKGAEAGECKPKLKLTTERAEADRSWRLDPDKLEVEAAIWVEKLEFVVWEYREGKDGDDKVDDDPKTRELHNQNNANVFTAARLDVKKPTDEFWARGGTVALASSGGVSLFSNAALTVAVANLAQAAFVADTVRIWVKGTGNTALDAQPNAAVDWGAWRRDPEKVLDNAQHVSCGARLAAKTLVKGDVVKLSTYSFDVHLDRKTSNECRDRLDTAYNDDPDGAEYQDLITKDVALAYAGAHKYYTQISPARINKNYRFAGGALFTGFIGAIRAAKQHGQGLDQQCVSAGGFIKNRLEEHGIALHATTRGMIQAYIRTVLQTNRPYNEDYGFDITRGVPGVHAEVLAVNDILNAIAGIEPKDITVATYRLQASNNAGYQGRRFVACTNCRGVLLNNADATKRVRVITG